MFDFSTAAPAASAPVGELTFESFNWAFPEEFSTILQEQTSRIERTVNDYRSVMTTVLTESAGAINENVVAVMEAANEDAPNKVMYIYLARNIMTRIQTMITSNEKALALREKAKDSGAVGKLKAEMYDYHLDAVNLDALAGNWSIMYKNSLYDISKPYNEANAAALDAEIQKVSAAKHQAIVHVVAAKAVKGTLPEGDFSKEVAKQLRGGGERKSVTFDMHYFDVLEQFPKIKESIQKAFTAMEKEVDLAMGIVKEKLGQVKKDAKTPEEKKHASGYAAYAIATRKVLSAGLDGAVLLNNLKLQAAVQQANEAKAFIVKAANFKAGKAEEGSLQESVIEPFLPYLDLPDNDDTSISAIAGLNESATTPFAW